jgi:hypothetical protein
MSTAVFESRLPARVVPSPTDRFYVRMAVVFLAVAVVGFAPTYWIPLVRGSLVATPITHIHALFFYGWLLLYLKQTSLAASGALVRHRRLGIAGVAMATALCFIGGATAVGSLRNSVADGFGDAARAFAIVPISGIAFFAVLFAVAMYFARNREVHKRLMFVNTAALLHPAIGRWFVLFLAPPSTGLQGPVSPPPVFVTVPPGLLADVIIVAAMIHDRRTNGRVHPAYWIAGGCVLAVQLLRVPLGRTQAWTMTIDAIARAVP